MHSVLRRLAAPRGRLPLALLALPLLSAALAGPARAQARVSVTILDHDETLCRQQMLKSGVDRGRPWWCVIGLARHPAGVAGVSVGGARGLLLADSAGGTPFVGLLPPGGESRHLSIVVEGRDGQSGAEHYRLTPGVVDLANPERQTYVLTNLRPRVLGGGDPLPPLPAPEPARVAQAAPPAAPPSAPPSQPSAAPAG
ncbi:MAG TPA: hypothetical protein VHG91_00110, partial [Longimicrobium sp.]|nr:hypothetical protein [Longimicrobium sp.]